MTNVSKREQDTCFQCFDPGAEGTEGYPTHLHKPNTWIYHLGR